MANKTKATPQKEEAREKGPETPDAPLPLLDLSDAAVTKMIEQAKKRGYVTYGQLNAVMSLEEVTSRQIEYILAMLNEMGIKLVETEEAEADEEQAREDPESEETEVGRAGRGHAEDAGKIRSERARRAHRRPGADVSARDGHCRASLPRGRDRDRQTHRGRPRGDDRRAVREPAHLPGGHHLA